MEESESRGTPLHRSDHPRKRLPAAGRRVPFAAVYAGVSEHVWRGRHFFFREYGFRLEISWPRFDKGSQRRACSARVLPLAEPSRALGGTRHQLVRLRFEAPRPSTTAGFFLGSCWSGMARACHQVGLSAPASVSGTSLLGPVPYINTFCMESSALHATWLEHQHGRQVCSSEPSSERPSEFNYLFLGIWMPLFQFGLPVFSTSPCSA